MIMAPSSTLARPAGPRPDPPQWPRC